MDPRRARVFGSFAADYDRWRPGYPDAAVDWLVPPGAHEVSDVGAGTGKLTGSLLARGLRVTAVEPDPQMLAVLADRHPGARAERSDAGRLPLPDAAVDAVLVAQAWHWFGKEQALDEARRVLRPGGWLGLVGNAPDPDDPFEVALDRLRPDHDRRSAGPDEADWDLPGVPAEDVETSRFAWTDHTTAADLRALSATFSIYAVMPEDERERELDAVVELAGRYAEPDGTVRRRQVAHCARVVFPRR
ncbi:class I SAM-dependent methyltransferase [Nakamurella flavida]|uniref:Class I SAM-dependent methyltransferase n=1 Tax=Nakamurella flavida TaxID=363630 RepID=A0A938YQF8_9ACTN|nr:class I SAM-dependent methyltransferase [Nakamurella flavida]MBM9477567.1 class I SAM-dependent methyltransferase [Nakamurella flavida]MDP9779115.1 SAM-dependent methyltransferase [Nakamurella flavida]